MPVDAVNVLIESVGAQLKAQEASIRDDEADHARREAEKKIAQKKEALKSGQTHRETFQRQTATQGRLRQLMGTPAGDSLRSLEENPQWQNKLTEAQKSFFRENMANNPATGKKAADAMNRLTGQPTFAKAITNSQQMGTLQQGLVQNPAIERPVAEMLQSRFGSFMQSPKADPQTNNRFLNQFIKSANQGQLAPIQQTGDMLGTLTRTSVGRNGMRAAMGMYERQPTNGRAVSNVDTFAGNEAVSRMPSFARTKAVELLARAGGTDSVRQGFEQLVVDPNFRVQTAQNKGRFFSTIGTGRPSEYRELTDKSLVALRHPGFPRRAGQVTRFLTTMSVTVQRGGARSVDPEALIHAAKTAGVLTPPRLASAEGLTEEEALRLKARNRAQLMRFFNLWGNQLDQVNKKLVAARYFEDVNSIKNLEPPEIDFSKLSPEEQALARKLMGNNREKLQLIRALHRQRARELRTKRMPPAKRRARMSAMRLRGRQPKYFNPNLGRQPASEVFAQVAGNTAPLMPMVRGNTGMMPGTAGPGMGSVGEQVAQAMAQLGNSPMTAERAGQVAQLIAQNIAQQVAQEVAQQLMGNLGTMSGNVSVGPRGGGQRDAPLANLPLGNIGSPPTDGTVSDALLEPLVNRLLGEVGDNPASPEQVQHFGGELAQTLVRQLAPGMPNAAPIADQALASGMAQLMAELGNGPMTRDKAWKVARFFSQHVARSLAEGRETRPRARPGERMDGFGVRRALDRDLGGGNRVVVKPPPASDYELDGPPDYQALAAEKFTGRAIVKDPTTVREIAQLFTLSWKQLSKAELAILRNLGWTRDLWDNPKRDTPAGNWPIAMATLFQDLLPVQRESVRKLHISPHEWDKRVQAFSMGKNA